MKLEVRDLCRSFGPVRALDRVSFEFSGPGIIGFVGPNGAGKTTLLRIMAGLDEPDAGDILLDGISAVDHPEKLRRRIGFMPDTLPDASDITVAEYLQFFAAAFWKGEERKRRWREAVEFAGCGEFVNRKLAELSKGMKQRVSLAHLLIHDPDLLLLDEPAAGLDPRARNELRVLLMQLAQRGKLILLSSHILADLDEMSSGAVIIDAGRIVRSGRMDALNELPVSETETVRLGIAGGNAEAQLETLRKFPGVVSAGVDGAEIALEIKKAEFGAWLAALAASGIPLASLKRMQYCVELEKTFLDVTGKEPKQ